MIIWLIGFMGSGKSTVGRHLADVMGWQFIDTDEVIVRESGKSISAIFKEQGESVFRSLEEQVFVELLDRQHAVVATGGGFPFQPGRMETMKSAGKVIYLSAPLSVLLERLGEQSAERPLISGLSGERLEQKVKELLSARMETYRQADLTVDSDDKAIDHIMTFIGTG